MASLITDRYSIPKSKDKKVQDGCEIFFYICLLAAARDFARVILKTLVKIWYSDKKNLFKLFQYIHKPKIISLYVSIG